MVSVKSAQRSGACARMRSGLDAMADIACRRREQRGEAASGQSMAAYGVTKAGGGAVEHGAGGAGSALRMDGPSRTIHAEGGDICVYAAAADAAADVYALVAKLLVKQAADRAHADGAAQPGVAGAPPAGDARSPQRT